MSSRHVRLSLRGFSIVEVLIALVVLSIGMLGIAALYVESLRAGRSAVYRTQAVNLASDMADRIRANRWAGAAYTVAANVMPVSTRDCGPGGGTCTPIQLAADDVARWRAAISADLPGRGITVNGTALPTGSIAVAAAGPPTNRYTITITWSEPGDPQLSYVLDMQI